MNNNFSIKNYLKSCSDKAMATLIEWWEVDRCAEGAEDVFDLKDKKDFIYFVDKYDIKIAIELANHYDYVIDGSNFNKPQPLTSEALRDFVFGEYDFEYMIHIVKEVGSWKGLEEYLDVPAFILDYGLVKENIDMAKIIKKVAGQIQCYIENDIINENGLEPFSGWCAEGEVFEDDDMSEEDIEMAMSIVNKIDGAFTNMVYEYLAIDKYLK